MAFIGGVEGGATNTIAVILNEKGEELGYSNGGTTHMWQIDLEENARRVEAIIEDAKQKAGVPKDRCLDSLGMCISGAEQEKNNEKLIKIFYAGYPNLAKHYFLRNDTFGSIATVCENGGTVLISGTGSNCQYVAADGTTTTRCGGWGHFMGDEGSAIWVAHRAVKYVFDHDDRMKQAPENPDKVREAMFKYFNTTTRFEMLTHFYGNWSKSFFAGFCKIVAEIALETGDPLCLLVFKQAGIHLANHIIALLPVISDDLKYAEGGLRVVCVGSVWKSWCLFKDTFLETLKNGAKGKIDAIRLVKPTKPGAIGAALLAAKDCKIDVEMDFKKNSTLFYETDI